MSVTTARDNWKTVWLVPQTQRQAKGFTCQNQNALKSALQGSTGDLATFASLAKLHAQSVCMQLTFAPHVTRPALLHTRTKQRSAALSRARVGLT